MDQYSGLAACYDRLIDQTIYDRFCGRICSLLQKNQIADGLVLELCCGTGTLARMLSQKGYELICCDASPEMLNVPMPSDMNFTDFLAYSEVRATISVIPPRYTETLVPFPLNDTT